MVWLKDISYSRDATITAITLYYDFLQKMYLPSHAVYTPPPGGWPDITPTVFESFGKTDEVIHLLQQLPYIQDDNSPGKVYHMAGLTVGADWRNPSVISSMRASDGEKYHVTTQGGFSETPMPPHIVGLTMGGRYNPIFQLDTQLGTVQWFERGQDSVVQPEGVEPVLDDPEDYAPPEEDDWRRDGSTWAIEDFFKVLEEEFRQLRFVPLSEYYVLDVDGVLLNDEENSVIEKVKQVYWEHGWPDLGKYDKKACLSAVRKLLEAEYPEWVDRQP